MPGNLMAASLVESWTVSADQRAYEFKLREGLKFHNGDPFTAEDVKFSFHRAKGSKILHDKGQGGMVAGPSRVRFHLHEPWPDFMTYYGTIVSGAGWVVPKKYVERVGDDGFRRAPVGLGPYNALYKQQAAGTDRKKREAQLHQIQRLVYERVRYGPTFEYVWPSGIDPRVAEPALMLINPYPWSAPLEEVRLKRP
jgi:ABC-type transport system substrate-binding protein